jgi:hypothetical protein
MKRLLITSTLLLLLPAFALAKTPATTVEYNGVSFSPIEDYNGIISVSAYDLGTDGVEEFLVGSGPGLTPEVHVYNANGVHLGSFLAYAESYKRGVNVTACDTDGDGTPEIITGTMFGGTPHVRVFDNWGNPITPGFFAYSESFLGGVNIACGDLDGDGNDEIVTSPGISGGAHVKVFTQNGDLLHERFAGSPTSSEGATVELQDVDSDGMEEIVVRRQRDRTAEQQLLELIDDELIWTQTGTFESNAPIINYQLNDGADDSRYILVDVSDQTLYAFEDGEIVHYFPVSTGAHGYTPRGNYSVTDKLLWHDYVWKTEDAEWNIPGVQYNLRFKQHYYIHYAYWHDNFGNPMSGGCVNVNLDNSKWIYEWSEVGVPVEIID